jgi:hypothetical protein
MNGENQFTFEGKSYKENIGQLPERTAYIDESGGFGFDFSKSGTLAHYVVCAIVVHNSEIYALEEKVLELRKTFFSGSEMKSSSIGSNHSRRGKILTELGKLQFSIIVLIADKEAIDKDSALALFKRSFIKYLHECLYETMYCFYPKLSIVEDEHGSSEFQAGYKEYVKNHLPPKDLFNDYDFKFVNSKANDIVQIADIIAGSINKYYEDPLSPNVLRMFQDKIAGKRIDFPRTYEQFYRVRKEPSGFDKQVYLTATKCASDYIEDNKKKDDEDIRLRVIFLKLLLFRIQNIGAVFIHSQDLVENLNELSIKDITRSYLYRKIIAPLRDEGVLIASGPHGYKIPTSVKDISTYLNQTISVVGPMLSRIEKCRELLKATTDGDFDILNDSTLLGYKNYFDNKNHA